MILFKATLLLCGSISMSLRVLVYPSSKEGINATTSFKDVPDTPNLEDLSFCVWTKVANLLAKKVVFYKLMDSQGIGLTLEQDYGFVKIKTIDLLFKFVSPHIPNKWYHWCIVYKGNNLQNVDVFMNGKRTFSQKDLTVLKGIRFNSQLLKYIQLGRPDKYMFQGEVLFLKSITIYFYLR